MVTLQLTPLCSSFRSFLSLKKHKKTKHHLRQQNHIHQNTTTTTNLSFPKPSSPTPLLLHQNPKPQSKLEALDHVLNDIQSAIDRGIKIEPQIFSSLLETCFQIQAFHHGIRLHKLIPPKLLLKNTGLSSKLLRLYASCGLIDEAHQLFDQMPSRETTPFAWNALISGYAELGLFEDAIALYFQMEEDGVEPDRFTFPRVLKACSGLGSIQIGEAVHRHVVRSGFGNDGFVLNALVDMYAKCGDIVKARRVFDNISNGDCVSWNSMLVGYFRHGLVAQALDVFKQMVEAGLEPDSVAISTILTRSSSSKLGYEIHAWVFRRGLDQNVSVANSLISMYAEAGRLDCACNVFEKMPERDVVSWNAIISAHCKYLNKAMMFFEEMENLGVSPDSITFTSLLSACANSCCLEDGRRLFAKMEEAYGMSPLMEHYACMVNLLGRAGLIDEAYEFIAKRLEFEGGPTVWGALLNACLIHGNVKVGEIAAERLFELEPDNEYNFELLRKIYQNAGRYEEEEKVKQMMMDRGFDL
eukprot:TRINITY_DN39682_c0_g2_i1.p1 TRINITY_DN39682_c0_g2~~TRINITY_DN39682_c0_g2_i1.p1  ORF type:complete len:561 (+),score=80.94 TRINITY_DN39682_c0_g2_i1:104-1684(+)